MMGAEKFMVTVRFKDELYPKSYFFCESTLAVNFFVSVHDLHKDFNDVDLQLWELADKPFINWKLLRTT